MNIEHRHIICSIAGGESETVRYSYARAPKIGRIEICPTNPSVSTQANFIRELVLVRQRMETPIMHSPSSTLAQVAGSGTAVETKETLADTRSVLLIASPSRLKRRESEVMLKRLRSKPATVLFGFKPKPAILLRDKFWRKIPLK